MEILFMRKLYDDSELPSPEDDRTRHFEGVLEREDGSRVHFIWGYWETEMGRPIWPPGQDWAPFQYRMEEIDFVVENLYRSEAAARYIPDEDGNFEPVGSPVIPESHPDFP